MPTPPPDPDCIFCRIVAGDIPCHKLHKDEHTLAFLDINPTAPGHTLLIPKAHNARLDEMPGETMAKLGAVLPRLAGAVAGAVGAPGYNILQNNGAEAGQAVFHVHFHIIPRGLPGSDFRFDWPAGKLESDAAADLIARITSRLA
ncbi:HIT family protein [Mucisphaera calidilacus]|uniref:HIT-like protein n=1 Tax=Mucisphaera calidilacus TaxID=2527982 RepID=A0A518BXF2_9BACT|nr:HIT family protein [Mucisphaera calidilacus]QDU71663.1 HIT-like protein [Mucisphaera calidilacus]